MNPANVRRQTTVRLTDLPNVGPAMARDRERIGIRGPADLAGRDPLDLYQWKGGLRSSGSIGRWHVNRLEGLGLLCLTGCPVAIALSQPAAGAILGILAGGLFAASVRPRPTACPAPAPRGGEGPQRIVEPGVSVGGTGRDWGDGLVCRIPSSATGGASCTFEQTLAPGAGVPLHVHAHDDELHVVLEGTIAMRCGDRDFTAASGTVAFLPRRVPHAFRNPGDAPARLVTVFTPGGFDDLVAELRGMPPADAGDETKRDVIRARHGIRIIHHAAG